MEVYMIQAIRKERYFMQSQDKPIFIRKTASLSDLGAYGLETLAYVKPVLVDGQRRHSIHAADGTPLTVIPERDLAFATVRQYDLEPASVH
jgi:hypothetical protein